MNEEVGNPALTYVMTMDHPNDAFEPISVLQIVRDKRRTALQVEPISTEFSAYMKRTRVYDRNAAPRLQLCHIP